MLERERDRLRGALAPVVLAVLVAGCGGTAKPAPKEPMEAQRPIAEVIADHSSEWMALPGVVGVYESRTGTGEPCLKVMVEKATPELRREIPERVEGYPVLLRETGPIAPRGGGDGE